MLDEFRSYGVVVAGEDVLIRYDSGHEDHKQYPHLAAPWAEQNSVQPSVVDLEKEVDLYRLLAAVDEWRAENAWRLPVEPPSLDQLRLP